jgi:hypothetical protein
MKLWQKPGVRAGLFLIFAAAFVIPAYSQRATLGVDVGETADRFGSLSRSTDIEAVIDGEVIVLPTKAKEHGADVLAGGEVRLPFDTGNHAREVALYAGTQFHFTHNFTAGFHIQVHKIYLPPSAGNDAVFNRDTMELVELPGFLQYKFGSGPQHAFIRAEGGREFAPRFHAPTAGSNGLPAPNLQYGYALRGTAGYVFGKWYLKATYESRYFKFRDNLGNQNGLYNWRSDMATAGVGFVF